jgi:hypothetical protein
VLRFEVGSKFRRARSRARTRINQITVLGNMMGSFPKADSRGVEAAARPQLTPVLNVHEFSANPRVSRTSPVSVISCSSSSSARRIRRWKQYSSSHTRSWRKEVRRISCLRDPSKFESVRIKSSMSDFTNHLGRVYHVRSIKKGLLILSLPSELSI